MKYIYIYNNMVIYMTTVVWCVVCIVLCSVLHGVSNVMYFGPLTGSGAGSGGPLHRVVL